MASVLYMDGPEVKIESRALRLALDRRDIVSGLEDIHPYPNRSSRDPKPVFPEMDDVTPACAVLLLPYNPCASHEHIPTWNTV